MRRGRIGRLGVTQSLVSLLSVGCFVLKLNPELQNCVALRPSENQSQAETGLTIQEASNSQEIALTKSRADTPRLNRPCRRLPSESLHRSHQACSY